MNGRGHERGAEGGVGLRRGSGVNLSTPTAPDGQTKGGERGQSARLNGQLVNTLQSGVSLATCRKEHLSHSRRIILRAFEPVEIFRFLSRSLKIEI